MIRSKIKLDIVNTVNNEKNVSIYTYNENEKNVRKSGPWVEKIEIKFNYKFIKEGK